MSAMICHVGCRKEGGLKELNLLLLGDGLLT